MVTSDYAIDLVGEVSEDLWPAFAPCEVSIVEGRTTIHADGVDQAALHGILDIARSFGLELVGVRRIDHVG